MTGGQDTPETEMLLQVTDRRASAVLEPPLAATQALTAIPTPAELVHLALTRGADPAILERLMDLQERQWAMDKEQQAREAESEFIRAMAAFKAQCPRIIKSSYAKHQDNWYASLDVICGAIDPLLANHGLSYRWARQTKDELGKPTPGVACIVTHIAGHSIDAWLPGDRETSGNKNSLQALGSANSYLRRYTLESVFGIAATRDDDGRSADSTTSASATSDSTDRKPEEKKEETRVEHAARVWRHYGVLMTDIEKKLGTSADVWGEAEWKRVNAWRQEFKAAPRESWPELARKLFDLEPGAGG